MNGQKAPEKLYKQRLRMQVYGATRAVFGQIGQPTSNGRCGRIEKRWRIHRGDDVKRSLTGLAEHVADGMFVAGWIMTQGFAVIPVIVRIPVFMSMSMSVRIGLGLRHQPSMLGPYVHRQPHEGTQGCKNENSHSVGTLPRLSSTAQTLAKHSCSVPRPIWLRPLLARVPIPQLTMD